MPTRLAHSLALPLQDLGLPQLADNDLDLRRLALRHFNLPLDPRFCILTRGLSRGSGQGLLVCACGHSLHGSTKTSGKKNGWKKNYYYTCGGYSMKGKSVCKRYWLPREMIEGPVMEALQKRIKSLARLNGIRKQVKALIGDFGTTGGNIKALERQLASIDRKALRWKKAIDKGLNMDEAVRHLNDLSQERSAVQADLDLARTRKATRLDVDSVTAEIMAGLDRIQQVIEEGSVAEVKAVLRRYIARVEYVPGKDKARIGFYDLPVQALLSDSASENADLCMVARVGFEPTTYGL
ncbi:MAG: recombinase zinc ribbon domain-containing protein [Planctomycetota bacterium]